jgi:hypothetical protein
MLHAGRNQHRPSSAAASDIEPDGVWGQRRPWENPEIALEYFGALVCRKLFALPKGRLFAPKAFDGLAVEVALGRHRTSLRFRFGGWNSAV